MNDEHWMRAWTDSHDQVSADITRGLNELAIRIRRLGKWIAAPNASGRDSAFTGAAARCGIRPKPRVR